MLSARLTSVALRSPFAGRATSDERQSAWDAYLLELELLWADYRAAGSTPGALSDYQQSVNAAKRKLLQGEDCSTLVMA